MKVCKNFIEKQGTTSATICQNCGCEKWEHELQELVNKEHYRFHENPICIYGGKGMLEYIKNMPPTFTMSDEQFQKTYFSENKPLTINIPTGQKAMELFDKALEEEFNKELRKNSFLALDEFFIKTANGKK